jgi:hypothetical protein
MATIEYGNAKIVIGTMIWAKAIQCSKDFIGFVEQSTDEPDTVVNTIGAYFALHAPHKIYIAGQLVEHGEHTITAGDETFPLTLPLTLESFMTLPGPLVGDWIEAATEQNDWLLKRLDFMVSRVISLTNAPPPDSGLSSEPTKVEKKTTTTG